MLPNRVLYYSNAIVFILLTQSIPYAGQYIKGLGGKREEQDSKLGKLFRITLMVLAIAGYSYITIVPSPIIENNIYSDIEGIVKESRCTRKQDDTISSYGVKIVRTDNGKEWNDAVLSDQNIPKGSILKVRTYQGTMFPSVAISVDGIKTKIYIREHEKFGFDPILDWFFIIVFTISNILVHIIKYKIKEKTRSTTKKGIWFWRIWNCGCALFSILMIVCIWWPINTLVQGYIWGHVLWSIYMIYQLAGYAHVLESAGFVWLPQEKVRRYESDSSIEIPEELQSTVARFVPFSFEEAEMYCEYRYKRQDENKYEWLGVCEFIYILVGLVIFFFADWSMICIIIGIGIPIIITPIYMKKSFVEKDVPIKDAFVGSCEYAIVDAAAFYKKIRGVCTDGSEIVWELKLDDDAKIKEGEKAAVVYLAAINRVFTEKVDIINQILNGEKEVKRYESDSSIEMPEELQSTVARFVPFSCEEAEMYCEYRYKRQKRNKNEWTIVWELIYIGVGLAVFFFVDWNMKWILMGIGILAVITPIYIKKSFTRKDVPIKDAFISPCEYAIVDAVFYKKIRGVCTDGSEIVWELKQDDDAEIKEGEKAAVVYLAAIDRVFTEKVDTINQILNKEEEE